MKETQLKVKIINNVLQYFFIRLTLECSIVYKDIYRGAAMPDADPEINKWWAIRYFVVPHT